MVCGAAGVAGVGFSAQTIGDNATVAPSPKAAAAVRPRVSLGKRVLSLGDRVILSSYCAVCPRPKRECVASVNGIAG
jgi:hypothetical protein